MALRWIEGWEATTTSMTTHARVYETATGTVTEDLGAARDLDKCIVSDDAVFTTNPIVTSNQNSWIIGLAFRADNATEINGGSIPFVALENNDGEQFRLEFVDAAATNKPGGAYYQIRAVRGATTLATSDQQFKLGIANEDWIYFEFKVTLDNTTGSFEGRFQYVRKPSLNSGTTALTWDAANTNVDTQEQTSTGANRFTLSMDTGSANDTIAVDDIYVCDNTGSKNNDYIGKVTIEDQKPSGDGDTTSWTLEGGASSTQDAWDETLTATEDDERLTSDALDQVHLCTVEPLALITAGTIVGVRQDLIARMETTGDLDIAHFFRKTTATAGESEGGTMFNVNSTTYTAGSAVLEDDPNTVTTWAVGDLDSYQHGAKNKG